MSHYDGRNRHPALPLPWGRRPFMDGFRSEPEEDMRDFLLMFVELSAKLGVKPERNFFAMVADEGAWYDPKSLSHDVEVMQCKFCFDNAQRTALKRKDLVYCEGFATAAFPMHHAWLIDAEGNVVDPTWADTMFGVGTAYIGIPFAREYVREYRAQCLKVSGGEISLLNNITNKWALLRHRFKLDYLATPADFETLVQANLPAPVKDQQDQPDQPGQTVQSL